MSESKKGDVYEYAYRNAENAAVERFKERKRTCDEVIDRIAAKLKPGVICNVRETDETIRPTWHGSSKLELSFASEYREISETATEAFSALSSVKDIATLSKASIECESRPVWMVNDAGTKEPFSGVYYRFDVILSVYEKHSGTAS